MDLAAQTVEFLSVTQIYCLVRTILVGLEVFEFHVCHSSLAWTKCFTSYIELETILGVNLTLKVYASIYEYAGLKILHFLYCLAILLNRLSIWKAAKWRVQKEVTSSHRKCRAHTWSKILTRREVKDRVMASAFSLALGPPSETLRGGIWVTRASRLYMSWKEQTHSVCWWAWNLIHLTW